MKIEKGPDFFLLIWYGMTHAQEKYHVYGPLQMCKQVEQKVSLIDDAEREEKDQ